MHKSEESLEEDADVVGWAPQATCITDMLWVVAQEMVLQDAKGLNLNDEQEILKVTKITLGCEDATVVGDLLLGRC